MILEDNITIEDLEKYGFDVVDNNCLFNEDANIMIDIENQKQLNNAIKHIKKLEEQVKE